MACFTGGVDSQETETLEVDSEGEKSRRGSEEQNVDLSDQSLTVNRGEQTKQNAFLGNNFTCHSRRSTKDSENLNSSSRNNCACSKIHR